MLDTIVWLVSLISQLLLSESSGGGKVGKVLLKMRRVAQVRGVGEGRCWERGEEKDKFRHERKNYSVPEAY